MMVTGNRPDEPEGVGDDREKHVTVYTVNGERTEHGSVYVRHATDAFLVSPDVDFPPDVTDRYPKSRLRRVEVTQHHSACFITTATTGEGATLDVLRRFRDDALGRTPVGRLLVSLYYAVSPPVAQSLSSHPDSRPTRTVRWLVDRCGDLARRREATDATLARLGLTLVLTLAYTVGLVVAVLGHLWLRVWDDCAGPA